MPRKVMTSSEPGWAWGQRALPLGVACPRGAWPRRGAEGHSTHCWTGAECLLSCPPRAGAETLGDLARGAGPPGQLLPLMSQGHE